MQMPEIRVVLDMKLVIFFLYPYQFLVTGHHVIQSCIQIVWPLKAPMNVPKINIYGRMRRKRTLKQVILKFMALRQKKNLANSQKPCVVKIVATETLSMFLQND